MMFNLGALFGFSKKKKKNKKSRSMSGSGTPSFGSASSLSSEGSINQRTQSTPKSVLPSSSCREFWYCTNTSCRAASDASQYIGKVTRRELETVLRRLGPDPPTDEEVSAMLSEADRAGDGCISLEAIRALGGAANSGPPVGPELWETFTIFDADKDGMISAEELLEMFVRLGDERCTLDDCRRMIADVDSNGDGHVCFEDFVHMMAGQ